MVYLPAINEKLDTSSGEDEMKNVLDSCISTLLRKPRLNSGERRQATPRNAKTDTTEFRVSKGLKGSKGSKLARVKRTQGPRSSLAGNLAIC